MVWRAVPIGCAVIGLMAWQGTLAVVRFDQPFALVQRMEDWRGAIRFVKENYVSDDILFVESGLIEGANLTGDQIRSSSVLFQSYLSCPVNNVYVVPGIEPVSPNVVLKNPRFMIDKIIERNRDSSASNGRLWILARWPASRADAYRDWIENSYRSQCPGNLELVNVEVQSYSGVLVFRLHWNLAE